MKKVKFQNNFNIQQYSTYLYIIKHNIITKSDLNQELKNFHLNLKKK